MKHPMPDAIKTSIGIAAITLFAFSTLEARTKVVDRWENGEAKIEKPQKVTVIAVLPGALMREAFEIDVAKKLSKKNRNVVAGSKIPGLSGGIRSKINTDAAMRIAKKISSQMRASKL